MQPLERMLVSGHNANDMIAVLFKKLWRLYLCITLIQVWHMHSLTSSIVYHLVSQLTVKLATKVFMMFWQLNISSPRSLAISMNHSHGARPHRSSRVSRPYPSLLLPEAQ
jgi:hypothetical protein